MQTRHRLQGMVMLERAPEPVRIKQPKGQERLNGWAAGCIWFGAFFTGCAIGHLVWISIWAPAFHALDRVLK